MGRAGAGSGGGGHSSGGRSSSRLSGGYRMGSSRPGGGGRPRGGSSSSDGGFPFGGYHSYHSSPFYGYGRRIIHHYHGGGGGNWVTSLITGIIALVIVLVMVFGTGNRSVPKSSYNREPLLGTGFSTNCVIDELGWVDNLTRTQRDLQAFHKKTGVQPYVYLKGYDPELQTEEEKRGWAESFYEQNIDNEHTFLMVYFAEQDADNDVGYMAHVCGKTAVSVMDAEATEIFYNYWENNWYSDKSTDAVIVDSFQSTAKRIMTKSNTMADVLKWAVIGVLLLGLAGFGIYRLKLKHKRAAEEAEETRIILNSPLRHINEDDL